MSGEHVFERYYDRQLRFRGIGPQGQVELRGARVVLVGCGALGSVIAERLTRAGVGSLRIIDRDVVERQNLQSQALFEERDARECLPKAVAAERRLREINPQVTLEGIVADFNAENAEELLEEGDLVLDGTDNFETRLLINDVCVKHEIPWIYNAVVESYGLTLTILPGETPCLRCLYPEPPPAGALPTCETSGLINPISALIAAVASAEALKLLVGSGELNCGLLYIDLWENSWRRFPLVRRADCPTCSLGCFEYLEAEAGASASTLCGQEAVQLRSARSQDLDLPTLAKQLHPAGEVLFNGYLLRFRAGEVEMTIFPDGRAIIHGTSDPKIARSVYAKYVGS
jgi:adenylyltransferase/sulfurtransferase